MLATLFFLATIPVCPNWINDTSDAVAPLGVDVSEEQLIKNKLRCYHELILTWKNSCTTAEKARCTNAVSRWLEKNFTVVNPVSLTCPGYQRRTYMINVRSGP